MPYVDYALTSEVNAAQAEKVKKETGMILSRCAGKPENWLYVRINPNQFLFFQGARVDLGAIVEVKLVGSLTNIQKKEITTQVCKLLEEELMIPPEKTYIVFTEIKGENWGWNGQLFG